MNPCFFQCGDRGLKKPKSRVDCIVAAARAPPRTGTSDVIELARRLNCHIWALHKTLEWLAKFKAKYGHLKAGYGSITAGRPVNTTPALRDLKTPFIKLESCLKALRPLYAESGALHRRQVGQLAFQRPLLQEPAQKVGEKAGPRPPGRKTARASRNTASGRCSAA